MVCAVAVGSAPDEVGVSVDPNRVTMRLMPAFAY